jgi:hypothetical protein
LTGDGFGGVSRSIGGQTVDPGGVAAAGGFGTGKDEKDDNGKGQFTQAGGLINFQHRYNAYAAGKAHGCYNNGWPICQCSYVITNNVPIGEEDPVPNPAAGCENIITIKSFKIDCCGHVCDFEQMNLRKPNLLIEEVVGTTTCCSNIEFLTADGYDPEHPENSWDCDVEDDNYTRWRLKLKKRTIKLPKVTLTLTGPTGCSAGEELVISALSIADDAECAPCGTIITATRKCITTGCTGGLTDTVTLVCDVTCESTSLLIKKQTLTFVAGCLTNKGTCA